MIPTDTKIHVRTARMMAHSVSADGAVDYHTDEHEFQPGNWSFVKGPIPGILGKAPSKGCVWHSFIPWSAISSIDWITK